ncbi:hypothetical protein KGM_203151 [Danaus plexippus plexippus]|uniref:Uncharacterized protein n=1 Tax=Danaus plexippus plexippus TaxID=278856 RepID=A0A212FJN1_DANPL|nr:hypothetical protein KGM_203151 [Danaus plexippus plexippus]
MSIPIRLSVKEKFKIFFRPPTPPPLRPRAQGSPAAVTPVRTQQICLPLIKTVAHSTAPFTGAKGCATRVRDPPALRRNLLQSKPSATMSLCL